MKNKESILNYPEEDLSKIQHLGKEWIELIGKKWDDILEEAIAFSVVVLVRMRVEKRT
jgi:hypothetical protein